MPAPRGGLWCWCIGSFLLVLAVGDAGEIVVQLTICVCSRADRRPDGRRGFSSSFFDVDDNNIATSSQFSVMQYRIRIRYVSTKPCVLSSYHPLFALSSFYAAGRVGVDADGRRVVDRDRATAT